MTDPHKIVLDETLEDAKVEYLMEMKELRGVYFKGKTSAENAYTEACSMIWRRFWEDVG